MVHGDCYVTLILYLHITPAYPSPRNSACYIMITVDCGSTSMINHLMTKSFKHTIRDVNVEVQELSVLHKYRGHRDVSETKLPLFYFFIPQLIVLHFLLTPLPPRIRVLHSTPTQSWQTWRRSGLSLLVFSSVR